MTDFAYYNGIFSALETAVIPMNDRAVYFGDGVYDVVWVQNGKPFALGDHLDRLKTSCTKMRITPPETRVRMEELCAELIARSAIPTGMMYLQISRASAPRRHAFPDASVPANLLMTLRASEMGDPDKILRLITVEDTRFFHCDIKTLNLIPNVMAAQRAEESGCDESVFFRGDRVTECAHSALAIVKNGVLRTSPLDNLILPSITRKHTLALCKKLSIPVSEEPYTRAELMDADEVLVMSTTCLIRRAAEIDGIPVGMRDEALAARLRDAYRAWFDSAVK